MGTLSPFVILVLALGSLAIAAGLLVWLIGYVRDGGRGRSKEPRQPPPAAESAPAGAQELLRVSRTDKDRLAVFVQGRSYRHLQDITDAQVGRETVEAIRTVLTFAEDWLPLLREAPPQPPPQRSAVEEQAFRERPRRSDRFPLRRPSAPPPLEPLIPVERINDLLQERLRERPDLAGRRICLTTDARGDLRIYVGQRTFEAVDDVTEPEVRAVIRDAIREWEDSYADPGEHDSGKGD